MTRKVKRARPLVAVRIFFVEFSSDRGSEVPLGSGIAALGNNLKLHNSVESSKTRVVYFREFGSTRENSHEISFLTCQNKRI